MPDGERISKEIRRTLKEVGQIQALLHEIDDKNLRTRLYNARSQREDAVRALVIQMATAMENLLNDLFRSAFLGYRPGSKNPKASKKPRGRGARDLDELLESGKLGFDAKLRLALVGGLITRRQYLKLDNLRVLRNKCAHNWILDVGKRRKRGQQSRRFLEHHGKNLFKIDTLGDFCTEYGPVYVSLFGKLLA